MMRRSSSANEEIISRATYLLNGATSADAFLQAYRAFHTFTQLAFLAVGLGLMAGVFLFNDPFKAAFMTGAVFGFAWASGEVTRRVDTLIEARRADLAFWYTKLILIENELPEAQRYFTELRVTRKAAEPNAEPVRDLREVFLQPQQIHETDVYRIIPSWTLATFERRMQRMTRLAWTVCAGVSTLYLAYATLDWLL